MRCFVLIILALLFFSCKTKEKLEVQKFQSLEVRDVTIPGTTSNFQIIAPDILRAPVNVPVLISAPGEFPVVTATPLPDSTIGFTVTDKDTTVVGAVQTSITENTSNETIVKPPKKGVWSNIKRFFWHLLGLVAAILLLIIFLKK